MKYFEEPVYVTRPYLPDLEDFKKGCEEIWANQWLSNNGPIVQRFEQRLADYFRITIDNIALFNNGTLALELGYYAMGLSGGDVITTPFTFVATSHALKRIGATPVFADIDPETLCLDPDAVEKLITPRTKAIVPVHVYGHLCDIEGFERLSKKYGIPVIYDAAHAFGIVNNNGLTVGTAGDMSMFSLHPTKLFHSCEGGVLVFKNPAIKEKLIQLRNFAIKGELECLDVGSNAKMNELQALMGCLCLDKIDDLIAKREKISNVYESIFKGTEVKYLSHSKNHAYCPVIFKDNATRERVYAVLKDECNIFCRRYFYPLVTDFAPYIYAQGSCPLARELSSRILTLPTYHELVLEEVASIARNVLEIIG